MYKDIELEHIVIKQNHIMWKLRFGNNHKGQANEQVINKLTDPRQCECGKLLYGSHFFTLNAGITGIEELETEHERVHAIARDIISGNNIPENIDAFILSSKKFLELLEDIYTEIEKREERKWLHKTS